MSDEDGWTSLAGGWNWDPVVKRNYAPSGYDRTHMFTAGWNYELPVGQGTKLAIQNKFADAVAGGWKVSGIFVAYTGTPFTVSGSGSSLQASGNSQTADLIGPVTKLGGKGPNDPYYAPLSFIDPLVYFNQTGVYRFGSTGRNEFRGPGYWQLSPGIYKDFKIKEKVNAEFRAESTNITNTPVWNNPNAGAASLRRNPDGSLNTAVADPYQNFMSITGASTGRQFRFGLRVEF